MKIKSLLFAAVALGSVISLPATAALTVAYATNFNTPTYSDGALIGQDQWVITGTSVVSPIAVAATVTNGNVTLAATGQDVRRVFTTIPAAGVGSVFLTASISVGSVSATGDYFLHLGDGGASNFNARLYAKSSGVGYVMGVSTGTLGTNTLTYGTEVVLLNTVQTVLIRYDFVTGLANDTGALFLNPTTEDGSGDTAYVAASTFGTDAVNIGGVYLRQGTGGPVVTVDNLAVLVPEPTSALLGALGFLAILRRRR